MKIKYRFKKICGIYEIHHKKSGRKYIGQSVNICDRWNKHITMLSRGDHHCSSLQDHFENLSGLSFQILEECKKEDLCQKEIEWWEKQENPFNGKPSKRIKGFCSPTEETKAKISKAHKGTKRTDETKKNMSESSKGRILSDEWKIKISEGNKGKNTGKIHSEEAKEKNRQAHEKAVEQWSLDGTVFIGTFESTLKAAASCNISFGHISNCCNGKRKTHGGFQWRYKI